VDGLGATASPVRVTHVFSPAAVGHPHYVGRAWEVVMGQPCRWKDLADFPPLKRGPLAEPMVIISPLSSSWWGREVVPRSWGITPLVVLDTTPYGPTLHGFEAILAHPIDVGLWGEPGTGWFVVAEPPGTPLCVVSASFLERLRLPTGLRR